MVWYCDYASPRVLWRRVDEKFVRELLVEILRNNRMPFDIGMPGIMPVFTHHVQLLRIVRAEHLVEIPDEEPCGGGYGPQHGMHRP